MKKTLLSLALCLCAGVAMAQNITYDYNGGRVVLESNQDLYNLIQPYYCNYAKTFRSYAAINKASTFFQVGTDALLTGEDSEYKWLGDYIKEINKNQYREPVGESDYLFNPTTNIQWRFNIHMFLNCAVGNAASNYSGAADFTEAGKFDSWIEYFYAFQGEGETARDLSLPADIIFEDEANGLAYTWSTALPKMEDPTGEKTFAGWYNSKGEMVDSIPAGITKEHYTVLWEGEEIPGDVTALENVAVESVVTKAIEKGQFVIIRNGVRYNALGAIVE